MPQRHIFIFFIPESFGKRNKKNGRDELPAVNVHLDSVAVLWIKQYDVVNVIAMRIKI
jgi:hypothetical protein